MTEPWLDQYLDSIEDSFRLLARHAQSRIEEAGGLSQSQFFVLRALDHGLTTVSELAARLGMTVPGATGMIDRLVKAGLVERTRDEADRRVVWVGLSETGRAQLAEARQLRRKIMAELLSPLTPLEVAQLVALYQKVAAHTEAATRDSCTTKE